MGRTVPAADGHVRSVRKLEPPVYNHVVSSEWLLHGSEKQRIRADSQESKL